MRVAIIGTREPQVKQRDSIMDSLEILKTVSDIVIVSGCAHGCDEIALRGAFNRRLHTVGCLPWNSYNPEVQTFCKELIVYDPKVHVEATESVHKYHPNSKNLTRGAFALHARNYLIIAGCDKVMAYPNHTAGGGGTGQGMRIATDLGIPLFELKGVKL